MSVIKIIQLAIVGKYFKLTQEMIKKQFLLVLNLVAIYLSESVFFYFLSQALSCFIGKNILINDRNVKKKKNDKKRLLEESKGLFFNN